MTSRVHFGTLGDAAMAEPADQMGPGTGLTFDRLIQSTATQRLTEDQKLLLADFERQRRAKQLPVPTDDAKVRLYLRAGGEPITLFGEGPYERRLRLRTLMAERDDFMRVLSRAPLVADLIAVSATGDFSAMEVEEEEEDEDEEFFTRASKELISARHLIAYFSLPRAKRRVAGQAAEQKRSLAELKTSRKELYRQLQKTGLYATQVGGERPLSTVAFRPDGQMLATGCFSGEVKLWSVPNCVMTHQTKGHRERVGGISWHPTSHLTAESSSAGHFASGGADGSVHLWNINQKDPVKSFEGHALRVSTTAFHPCGRHLGTASFDMSWRLWDLETTQELLLQEGHTREVISLDFQLDGALAVSGGMDGIGRVWDLRSGRSIMLLEGHVQSITDVAFLPAGYTVATASADNSVRIHDIRQLKSSVAMVPAHTNLVSKVKFHSRYDPSPAQSLKDVMFDETEDDLRMLAETLDRLIPRPTQFYADYMVTSSFDGTAKVWGAGDWKLLSTCSGHSNKVMGLDITQDGQFIVTASYDRTFKLWTNDPTMIL